MKEGPSPPHEGIHWDQFSPGRLVWVAVAMAGVGAFLAYVVTQVVVFDPGAAEPVPREQITDQVELVVGALAITLTIVAITIAVARWRRSRDLAAWSRGDSTPGT